MTSSHIPSSVRKLLQIYKSLSYQLNNLYPHDVSAYLSSTSDLQVINNQWQLLRNNRIKGEKLSSVLDLDSHMFMNPIQFGPYELKKTSQLFDTSKKPLRKSLIPNTNNSSVNNGKYVSNVENAIRSYYSPYGSLPKTKKLQDAFKFYATQFDSNIPITLLFKSTADLFSTFPMSHYDASYVEFKAAVDDINANHGTGYRFSRIQNIDLFNLALRYNSFMNTTVKDDTNIPWEKVNQVQDSLVDMVRHTQKVDIIQTSTGNPTASNDLYLREYLSEDIDTKFIDSREIMDFCEQMPYTIRMTNYYMMNILDLFEDKHSLFVRLLESTDMQIIGARLWLNNGQLNEIINEIIETRNDGSKTSYEDLLKLTHVPDKNDVCLMMEYLATKGLVSVKQSADKNALYLLP